MVAGFLSLASRLLRRGEEVGMAFVESNNLVEAPSRNGQMADPPWTPVSRKHPHDQTVQGPAEFPFSRPSDWLSVTGKSPGLDGNESRTIQRPLDFSQFGLDLENSGARIDPRWARGGGQRRKAETLKI